MKSKIDYANDKVYEHTANKLEVDVETVKEVINIQSLLTKEVIEKGDLDAIRYCYLGVIKASPKKAKFLKELNPNKK